MVLIGPNSFVCPRPAGGGDTRKIFESGNTKGIGRVILSQRGGTPLEEHDLIIRLKAGIIFPEGKYITLPLFPQKIHEKSSFRPSFPLITADILWYNRHNRPL